MEKTKAVIIAETMKSFALALIGVCFISMGSTYFVEQVSYNVPRILIPVFNLFGHIGLAIGLILLGLGFIIYGFVKWRKIAKSVILYPVIVVPALIIGICLAVFTGAFKDRNERKMDAERQSYDERQSEMLDKVQSANRPDFKNEKIDAYLAEFDEILKKMEECAEAKNTGADRAKVITELEAEYQDWLNRSPAIYEELDKGEDKAELATYMAKLTIRLVDVWQKIE